MAMHPAVGPEVPPDAVRRLRGGLSRAAFARTVGVTAQTVYRWELPDTAAESRRPRGAQLARLQQLLQPAAATEPAFSAAVSGRLDEDVARVLPGLERILHGDLRRGHGELVQAIARGPSLSANARGYAYFGIALCDLLERADARAALLAITPLLADAEAGRLDPDVAAKLFSVAALAHAAPDVWVFDLGRVHAYQARAEASSSPSDQDAACVAWLAALSAATWVGDRGLLERTFLRLDEAAWSALPPLLSLHLDEFRFLRALYDGKSSLYFHHVEASAQRAEQHAHPLLLARSLGRLALSQLDNLADPEQVLLNARRAKALTHGGRVCPGVHALLALRAELEALLRLGRVDEALLVSGELDAWSVETGLPPLVAVSAQNRLFQLTGRVDELRALAAQLTACQVPSMRPLCQAYASYVEATALLTTSEDPLSTIELYAQAETHAERWPFLLRDVLLYRVYAHAAAGDSAGAQLALRRAQRFVDGFPSPWYTAHLRRLEGGLLASRGQWREGRQLLEAAIATFDVAKDACDATLTRYLASLIENFFDASAVEPLAAARAELARLGLRELVSMRSGVARFGVQLPRDEPAPAWAGQAAERLVVPFQRVAMRGAAPSLVLAELVAVASDLFVGRPIHLEEIDSDGTARALSGALAEGQPAEWAEFSDGAGRLLRLGVEGELAREERSMLSLLVMTAALSLEVAVLRSVSERSGSATREQAVPEIPGFVAASAEMRKLRAELVRVSSSRSTVIITGESGVGKELVARAIHDLSERSSNSYVAFNCATVPRDLFEGQLFGYRRGAFTGATQDHPGVIRAANRGTLFLDEIGELPLDIQPKLLRYLENAEVFPLGERAPVHVDVRVLAATHRDLAALVREGKFREDLYYRLQVVPVFVPPLRERRADVPVLARHFLRALTRQGEPPVLAPDALLSLLEHPFPGNVRELKNIIERALAYHGDQTVLRAEHLKLPERSVTAANPVRPRS